MRIPDLRDYEDRERELARRLGGAAAPHGWVVDGRALYRDVLKADRIGFQRTNAPLSALLYLYETVVVYIPPMPQRQLEGRLGMPWPDFMKFCEAGFIQPVIGHPTHYSRRPFFDSLFECAPPSVWARGDELAHVFADAGSFWQIAMSDMPAEQMVGIDWIRSKFRKHFPTLQAAQLAERIAIELRTNFVDLCIFGYEPLARRILATGSLEWRARQILQLSEVLTYPHLIGMGGTPNYGLQQAPAVAVASQGVMLPEQVSIEVGPEADILLGGLGFSINRQANYDLVQQFHRSELSPRLWKALRALEAGVADEVSDPTNLTEVSVAAQNILKDSLRLIDGVPARNVLARGRSAATRRMDLTLKMGSASAVTGASGVLGVEWVAAAGLGLGLLALIESGVSRKWSQAMADAVYEALMKRRYGDLAVQLWWLKQGLE